MHDPIKEAAGALRVSARSLRSTADVDESQGFATLAGHGREVAAGRDRAADLLEALSNPPETVEELRERAEALLGYKVHAEWVAPATVWCHRYDPPYLEGGDIEAPTVRAAWFAIVAMEVERG